VPVVVRDFSLLPSRQPVVLGRLSAKTFLRDIPYPARTLKR
jgi:hypothetical protein